MNIVSSSYSPLRLAPIGFLANATRDFTSLYTAVTSNATHASKVYAVNDYRTTPDRFIQHVIAKYAPPGSTLIELGCGAGNNLIPLAQKGYQIFGLDIQRTPIRYIRSNTRKPTELKKRIHLRNWDFAETGQLPHRWNKVKGRVAAIYAVGTLNHINDEKLKTVIPVLSENLAPGGVFIFSNLLPNPNKAPDQISLQNGSFGHRQDVLDSAFQGLRHVQTTPFGEAEQDFITGMSDHALKANILGRMSWHVYQKVH